MLDTPSPYVKSPADNARYRTVKSRKLLSEHDLHGLNSTKHKAARLQLPVMHLNENARPTLAETDSSIARRRRRTRGVQLLVKLLESGHYDRPRLAAELVVREEVLERFLSGEIEFPLERQLCLAQFVVANAPGLARHGHNLLSQTRAALAFQQSGTSLHGSAPVPNARSF